MIGWAENNLFGPRAIGMWRKATAIVSLFPEKIDGEILRCHEVARAVSTLLGTRIHPDGQHRDDGPLVVDGSFGVVDHSWLRIEDNALRWCILDPYAIGRIPLVQLIVDEDRLLPYHEDQVESRWSYRRRGKRDDVRADVVKKLVAIGDLR